MFWHVLWGMHSCPSEGHGFSTHEGYLLYNSYNFGQCWDFTTPCAAWRASIHRFSTTHAMPKSDGQFYTSGCHASPLQWDYVVVLREAIVGKGWFDNSFFRFLIFEHLWTMPFGCATCSMLSTNMFLLALFVCASPDQKHPLPVRCLAIIIVFLYKMMGTGIPALLPATIARGWIFR